MKPNDRAIGAPLLDQVGGALDRYVLLPSEECATAVTLWIAATHAAPAWNTAARLVIRAPEKRCGKSRLLDVIEAICHRPVMTVNASPSAIYRLIGGAQGDPPTVLIDEADTIFGHDAGAHEDLRGLLNAGHQRGRPALRWDMNTRSVEELDTYAMAALAGIGRLPDTIEDRGVVIKMRRRAPAEYVHPYRLRRDSPPLNQLRMKLHRWARSHLPELTAATPDMPLEDRAADTWEALIAIADLAAGEWPDRARHAAATLTAESQENDADTLATQLLGDCREAFAGRSIIRTDELLTSLKSDLEAPWATYGASGLTPRMLAIKLKEFGIQSQQLRFSGNQQRGYAANDFVDAWSRYLPPIDDTPSEDAGSPENSRHKRHTRNNPRPEALRLVTDSPARDGSTASTKPPGAAQGDEAPHLRTADQPDHRE